VNKISETVATTSAHDSDDNFSDTSSNVTDYFKLDNKSDYANKSNSNIISNLMTLTPMMSMIMNFMKSSRMKKWQE